MKPFEEWVQDLAEPDEPEPEVLYCSGPGCDNRGEPNYQYGEEQPEFYCGCTEWCCP